MTSYKLKMANAFGLPNFDAKLVSFRNIKIVQFLEYE